MYLLILILPLFSFLSTGFFGRYLGRNGSSYFTIVCMVITWCISILAFYEVALCKMITIIPLYDWIIMDVYTLGFGLLFDSLSVLMTLVVVTISLLVHLYSISYMSHDPHISRFMGYLSLFTYFMLVLVTSSNFIQMFIGWEGVGICSYLLINFWFTRVAANKAALKAMIMNRIADVFFIIAMIYILLIFKTTDYLTVVALIPYIASNSIIFLGIELQNIVIITFFYLSGQLVNLLK